MVDKKEKKMVPRKIFKSLGEVKKMFKDGGWPKETKEPLVLNQIENMLLPSSKEMVQRAIAGMKKYDFNIHKEKVLEMVEFEQGEIGIILREGANRSEWNDKTTNFCVGKEYIPAEK